MLIFIRFFSLQIKTFLIIQSLSVSYRLYGHLSSSFSEALEFIAKRQNSFFAFWFIVKSNQRDEDFQSAVGDGNCVFMGELSIRITWIFSSKYRLTKVMGIQMTILSLLAIMAHNCMFPIMQTQPLTYLMHLLYFRSRHCEAGINWSFLLASTGDLTLVEAQLPIQAAAVTRTFVIGIHYLILNLLLTFAAISCICKWIFEKFQIRLLNFSSSFHEEEYRRKNFQHNVCQPCSPLSFRAVSWYCCNVVLPRWWS